MRVPLFLMLVLCFSGCESIGNYFSGGPDVSQIPTLNDRIVVLQGQVAQTQIAISQAEATGADPAALRDTLAIQEAELAAVTKQRDDIQNSASSDIWGNLIDMALITVGGVFGLGGVGTAFVQARKAKKLKGLVPGVA